MHPVLTAVVVHTGKHLFLICMERPENDCGPNLPAYLCSCSTNNTTFGGELAQVKKITTDIISYTGSYVAQHATDNTVSMIIY